MSDHDEHLGARVSDALDASSEELPLGVATRLAAARRDAIATRTRGVWFTPARLAAFGSVALVALAVALLARTPGLPADTAEPALAEAALPADAAELEMALEMELMEDLEFVAWLALEDAGTEASDAG